MELAAQLFIGTIMIGLTVAAHAMALDYIIRTAGPMEKHVRKIVRSHWKPDVTGGIVISVFLVHVCIIWGWAILYTILDCAPLQGFADALYFSTVSYSTVGFGDIVLGDSCRMLSGIEASDGFILFGWTGAFIFEVVRQIYRKEASSL